VTRSCKERIYEHLHVWHRDHIKNTLHNNEVQAGESSHGHPLLQKKVFLKKKDKDIKDIQDQDALWVLAFKDQK
jgi:hypothetical protein